MNMRNSLLLVLVVCIMGLAIPQSAEARVPPPNVVVGGWRFQIRGDRPHSLGSCVSQPVSHFHIEVFQGLGGGRYRYLSNFHVGSYYNGHRCFVVYNNYTPQMCVKTCDSSQGGLQYVIKTAVFLIAAAFGIALSATLGSLIAATLAAPIYFALP